MSMWIEAISGGGVTPTPITPSNASPVFLPADTPVNPTASGYAIKSYYNITPGNPPQYMTQGNIYKAAAAGWAIDDYSDITPTADGAYFASGMRRMSSSGYAYSQKPAEAKTGTFSGVPTTYKLNLGFKPKQICIYRQGVGWAMFYDENYSTTQFFRVTGGGVSIVNLGATSTSNYNIKSIDDDGITLIFNSSTYAGYTWNYYAIG